jgi:hypothetical protein
MAVTIGFIEYTHKLLQGGSRIIPPGTLTDGASIPRPFRWFVGQPFDPRFWRASLIHDVLYREEVGRRVDADRIYTDYLRQDGVGKTRRLLMWIGLRIAFWKGWGQ